MMGSDPSRRELMRFVRWPGRAVRTAVQKLVPPKKGESLTTRALGGLGTQVGKALRYFKHVKR